MAQTKIYRHLVALFTLLTLAAAGCTGNESEMTAVPPTSVMTATATTAAPAPIETPVPGPTDSPTPDPSPTPDAFVHGSKGLPWWNDSAFYQIFVRSFKDSDGDGIGDLQGIVESLDYLNDGDPETTDDLGITGIWLMPIFDSPSYHGYDVTDYYTINPEYGTDEDFKQLMAEAHERGIRVILDFPLNHTSAQHAWFIDSAGDLAADLRDWYIWEPTDPGYLGPWGQPVWHPRNGEFYYGLFWDQMPDLNFRNPEVTEAIYDVTRYWQQEMSADGFRLDGVRHLIEAGELQENAVENNEWLQGFYSQYKANDSDAFVVAEIWSPTSQIKRYVENGDQVDTAFEFELAEETLNSVRGGFAKQFNDRLERVVNTYPEGQYSTFLANHDMDRTMSQLGEDEGKARVAASLQLTAPGVPFIYYGEEIGMTGERGNSPGDEPRRLPMQWDSDSTRAGFSSARPWQAVSSDFESRSVALQTNDADSLLSHYRNLIRLRDQEEALRVGEWTEVRTNNGRVYAALRHTNEEVILVVVNLSSLDQEAYALELEEGPLSSLGSVALLMGSGEPGMAEVTAAGGFSEYKPLPSLAPHSTTILKLLP